VRFTYASNGKGIYAIDMDSGEEGEAETFPTPQDLWRRTFAKENAWRDRFAAIPYPDRGGSWQIRFYEDIAVKRVLEAIASGQDRILLTLATGSGKTSIAFLIIWMLFAARWNRSGQPSRRPRILFLADRNNLADSVIRNGMANPRILNPLVLDRRCLHLNSQNPRIRMGTVTPAASPVDKKPSSSWAMARNVPSST
jgi:type I restriction enzyme R subunit